MARKPASLAPVSVCRVPDSTGVWEDSLWMDQEWIERLCGLVEDAVAPEGVDPKWMALVALAVDASPPSLYPQGMRRHMRRALELGASRQEIAAVLRYVSIVGQHSVKLGSSILKEELVMRPQDAQI